jgi:ABC-type antimicrobial peptide transport system permease subunit
VEYVEAVSTTLLIGFLGLIAGFGIGLAASRLVGEGFWLELGCSAAIVLAIAGVAALLGRLGGDAAPTLAGERLRLEVELKCPRG